MVIKTLNDIYLDLRGALIRENHCQADLEAREICAFGAGITRDEFEKSKMLFLSDESSGNIYSLFNRLLSGEPLPYIIGEWDFFSLTFRTPPGVLIPRPDTETLVYEALKAANKRPVTRVLDLCCGTGCVGISFAKNYPDAKVVLADISPAALKAAKENLALHSLTGSSYAITLDVMDGWTSALGTFDLILANPPYIASEDILSLDRSVRDFEPHLALDGGLDGLSFYRVLSEKWKQALKPGGQLFVECGISQADDVKSILKKGSFKMLRTYKDLSGVSRVVSGRA